MNRADLQKLAADRLRDAEVLLDAGQWSGAFYLAGYAVECALKACIAKLTNLHDFPDRDRTNKSYTHKIEDLVFLAGLKGRRDADASLDADLERNWQTLKDWNGQARQNLCSELRARSLFEAVNDPKGGSFRMDYGPLVTEEIQAGAMLIREFDRHRPVKAAFWLRASDENQRYLYLASDQIGDGDIRDAYGVVSKIIRELDTPDLDPMRIKVITGDDSMAREATDYYKLYEGRRRMPNRIGGVCFGGTWADDVYLYPPLARVGA